MAQPVHYRDLSIAPSSMAFYEGDKVPRWRGNLLVCALKYQLVARMVATESPTTVVPRSSRSTVLAALLVIAAVASPAHVTPLGSPPKARSSFGRRARLDFGMCSPICVSVDRVAARSLSVVSRVGDLGCTPEMHRHGATNCETA